jgi:hypothetical protein
MRHLTGLRHLALALLVAAPAAAQTPIPAECQPLMAAGDKQFTIPSHAYITSKGLGPTPMQSETININGVTYVMTHDRWIKSPMTSEQIGQRAKETARTAKVFTCKQLPDETVGGVPASVYSSHNESATGGTTDTQVWIAKTSGMALKSEVDIIGAGGHKSHMSVRFEYENVKAPAGVQ